MCYCFVSAEDAILLHMFSACKLCSLSHCLCVVGVHSVAYAFPKVHLVTTAVDPEINDHFYILPGIGEQCNYGCPLC